MEGQHPRRKKQPAAADQWAGHRELSLHAHEVCSVLDDMQAQVVALTHLRSMVGLVRLCRRAAATPARLCVLLARAR